MINPNANENSDEKRSHREKINLIGPRIDTDTNILNRKVSTQDDILTILTWKKLCLTEKRH